MYCFHVCFYCNEGINRWRSYPGRRCLHLVDTWSLFLLPKVMQRPPWYLYFSHRDRVSGCFVFITTVKNRIWKKKYIYVYWWWIPSWMTILHLSPPKTFIFHNDDLQSSVSTKNAWPYFRTLPLSELQEFLMEHLRGVVTCQKMTSTSLDICIFIPIKENLFPKFVISCTFSIVFLYHKNYLIIH